MAEIGDPGSLESACERIPHGLPRGKRAKNWFVPLKDRSFSAASSGELQFLKIHFHHFPCS
jgi:hypothetical protein